MLATYADTLPLSLQRKRRLKKARAWNLPDIQFMEVDGATIRYRVVGNDGPTLVICPDPPVMIEHYNELVERLSGHCRVVLFELPAFGFSIPKFGLTMQADRVLPKSPSSSTSWPWDPISCLSPVWPVSPPCSWLIIAPSWYRH